MSNQVFVYWNLHKKCWSCRDTRTRRVIKHLTELSLFDAVFKVSEAGRQRVLREKCKNVHAGVVGRLSEGRAQPGARQVKYNPYRQALFTIEGQPIKSAFCVMFHPNRTVTALDPVFHASEEAIWPT